MEQRETQLRQILGWLCCWKGPRPGALLPRPCNYTEGWRLGTYLSQTLKPRQPKSQGNGELMEEGSVQISMFKNPLLLS